VGGGFLVCLLTIFPFSEHGANHLEALKQRRVLRVEGQQPLPPIFIFVNFEGHFIVVAIKAGHDVVAVFGAAPHSPSTFALRVKGDSMTAPYGRSYPDGCIIYVDPERRSPKNGDRIVACLDGDDDEVTFKIYKNEDGRQWLLPLNPQHPPLFERFKVIGTVLGKWEDG
jgi:hypothetical protein